MVSSDHHFYKRIVQANPRPFNLTGQLSDVVEQGDHEDFDSSTKAQTVTKKLPFNFVFYEDEFDEVVISTFGNLYLVPRTMNSGSDDIRAEIAPFKIEDSNFKAGNTSINLGWTKTKFVVSWTIGSQLSFQVTLRADGEIIFKYFKIPKQQDLPNRFIGVGRVFQHVVNKTKAFQIKSVEDHIQPGVTVRFIPLQDTCQKYSNSCSSCITDPECSWCQGQCQFGYKLCTSKVLSMCPTSSVDMMTLVWLSLSSALSILICSLLAFLIVKRAVQHPASYPGQILVRLRMRGYMLFHGRPEAPGGGEDNLVIPSADEETVDSTL